MHKKTHVYINSFKLSSKAVKNPLIWKKFKNYGLICTKPRVRQNEAETAPSEIKSEKPNKNKTELKRNSPRALEASKLFEKKFGKRFLDIRLV